MRPVATNTLLARFPDTPRRRDRDRAHHRLQRHLNSVKDSYNGVQSRYVEDRIPTIFPLSNFGYQVEGASVGYAQNGPITLCWAVSPMPYAHDADPDLGVSEEACAAILNDLRQGMFWIIDSASFGIPPVGKLSLADAVRVRSEYWFNYEAEEPNDVSELTISLLVSLARGRRRVACKAPLGALERPQTTLVELSSE